MVCYWPGLLVLVSRFGNGEKISFFYDTPIHLAAELDSVRIISTLQHELLQKVSTYRVRTLLRN